jgi:hypothetical protein
MVVMSMDCCAVFVAVFLRLVARASGSSLSSLSGELLFVLLYFKNSHSFTSSPRVSAHREITPNLDTALVGRRQREKCTEMLLMDADILTMRTEP